MRKLIVDKKFNEKKLNTFLLHEVDGLTYSLFANTLRKKDIKVNGKRVNTDIVVYTGDEILLYLSDELLESKSKLSNIVADIPVVYEDTYILILNKPQGIEVTGNSSLTTYVHSKYSSSPFLPMPCHRLDRNTCGLVLFAKTKDALDILLEKFKLHEIEKHYYAWVYNIPKKKCSKMCAYLFKDNKKSRVYISDVPLKGYQKIITSYSVLHEYANNSCLLDVQIETGKTHQIRAHLSHIGLPIIGDGKYGVNSINKLFHQKVQCLCSYKLKFCFKGFSGILDYLNGFEIQIDLPKWNI